MGLVESAARWVERRAVVVKAAQTAESKEAEVKMAPAAWLVED